MLRKYDIYKYFVPLHSTENKKYKLINYKKYKFVRK